MKKIFYIIICGLLIVGMTGCGNEKEEVKVKEDGPNRESELQSFLDGESKEFTEYDTEVFYTEDLSIFYEIKNGYETVKKEIYSGEVIEEFNDGTSDNEISVALSKVLDESVIDQCESKYEYNSSSKFWKDVVKENVTEKDLDVCYITGKFLYGEREIPRAFAYVNILDKYAIRLEFSLQGENEVNYEYFKEIIESIEITKK